MKSDTEVFSSVGHATGKDLQAAGAKRETREQRLYDALKRIARYQPPDRLRRTSQKQYGLEGDEAIEYAYENVLEEARRAIKGMRRPVAKREPA